MIKFSILTGGRTGSTFLVRTLNRHPEIFCAGEFFHPGNIKLPKERFEQPLKYLYDYYDSQNKQVCGCKLILVRDEKYIQEIIKDSQLNIILKRRNRIQQVISSFIANKVNNWDNYANLIEEPFEIPFDYIDRFIIEYEERDKSVQDIPNQFPLFYREFSVEKFNELFEKLGVSTVSEIDFEQGPQRKYVYHLIKNKKEIEQKFGFSLED